MMIALKMNEICLVGVVAYSHKLSSALRRLKIGLSPIECHWFKSTIFNAVPQRRLIIVFEAKQRSKKSGIKPRHLNRVLSLLAYLNACFSLVLSFCNHLPSTDVSSAIYRHTSGIQY